MHVLGYRDKVLTRFFPYKVYILLLTAVSNVHRCILFVRMFSILVFTAVSAVHKCSLFTLGLFLKWLFFDNGERYIERACRFILSVVELQRVKIIQLVAKNSVCCRISTSNESGRQSVVESQRIKSYWTSRVVSNLPVYSLRRICAYDELQKSLQQKSGTLDRRLQHYSKHGDEYVGSKQGNLLTRKVTHKSMSQLLKELI